MFKILNEKSATFYTVQPNDTLEKVCKIFNVEKQILEKCNDIENVILESGDVLYIPCQNLRCHVVAPLDTLSKISQKYNVSEKEIIERNKVSSLFIGQKLYF